MAGRSSRQTVIRARTLLNPSAVILADESLPVQSRETVKTRIELWIAATTRRLLGPLFVLEAIQEGPEIVQNLAHDLARSLGILEREPIRAQINALAQNDRAELRKQGVRFGAYYLFVPALIKPAPRNLALQLWGLQARGDANDLLRTLGPVASSGRTSLAWDNTISKDGYRVAGYRPCGERVVRVDVVERLAGMVRAAIASEAPGLPNHRTAKGFVVSGEMTSLTGCSGDQFASILRSMGFRPVEMRRSDFFAPAQADESPGESESAAADEGQGQIGDDQPSSPAAGAEETTPDAILASPPAEPLVDGVAVDMAPAPVSRRSIRGAFERRRRRILPSADARIKLRTGKKYRHDRRLAPRPSQEFTRPSEGAQTLKGRKPWAAGYGQPRLGPDARAGAQHGCALAREAKSA